MQTLAMMMMMMMMSSYSSLADQSLNCHNDFHNNFTCVWDTSKLDVIPPVRPETKCWMNVSVQKIKLDQNKADLIADPMQPHIRSATVVFQSKRGIMTSTARLHEVVWCENNKNPVAEIAKHTGEESAVKVAPPQRVNVHGVNVSWSCDSLKPYFTSEFEVQYRSAAQSWKDVEGSIVKTSEPHLQLSEDNLLLNHQYVIRVRVRYVRTNALWSDWSEEYSWTSDVGQTAEMLPLDSSKARIILTIITLAIIVIFTVLIRCKRIRRIVACSPFRVQKKGSTYIPDPSKFFGDLNSSHRGNFTSWLGSVLVHESFIRVDTEFISPVEVLKLQDACDSRSTCRNSGSLQDTWGDTVKSSNFSNSTYFLSQSSKGPSDTLEPCSAHSSYGPAGGGSGVETLPQCSAEEKDAEELEFSLKKLEKLRQDTQSPDSGFAGGAEDSMEETELPSPLCLTLLPHLPQDLPAPQPNRHPLLGLQSTDLLLRPSCPIPGLDLDLQSCCGLIEPSSGDYMPVKNVQS